MGYMPDGNSAALRQFEREQAQSSALWDAHAEGIAEGWADELMDGKKANGYTLHNLILDYLTDNDLVPIFVLSGDKRQCAIEDAEKRLRERLISFFLESCQDDIWDAINDRSE